MTMEQGLGILRSVLAYGAGFAAAHGYLASETANTLVAAGVAIATAAWSVWSKRTT
jgi:hypothetical protein